MGRAPAARPEGVAEVITVVIGWEMASSLASHCGPVERVAAPGLKSTGQLVFAGFDMPVVFVLKHCTGTVCMCRASEEAEEVTKVNCSADSSNVGQTSTTT